MSKNCKVIGCNEKVSAKGMCKFHYNKNYYENNREEILEQKKLYASEHKEDKKEYDKVYRKENEDRISLEKKDYNLIHKEDRKEYDKIYRQENKLILNEKRKSYYNGRMRTDPVFRLRKIASSLVRIYLKKSGATKNGISILKYLPYSFQELKEYLEKQFEHWMTWDNQGAYIASEWDDNDSMTWTWQLDHIIPQSKLPYTSMEDDNFQRCWALENLRPLSAKQNLLDGAR